MIRYDITPDVLHEMVEEYVPGWTLRAQERTESFRAKGKYEERGPIWSEVKPVFMRVQGEGKCCFCERKFESGDRGRYELDLDHFRPKRNVRKWTCCPPDLIDKGVSLTVPPDAGNGYYLLPYHLLNYAAACKPCNSGFKKDLFPIAGRYALDGEDPREMGAEQPWLLYPIGRLDVDPEDVIAFHGILPQSTSDDPFLRLRGFVTIAFFCLDDVVSRKNLMRERAAVIVLLHAFLVKAEDHGDIEAAAFVKSRLAPTEMHTNCARSFGRLFGSNRTQADEVAGIALGFLTSGSL